MGAVQVVLVAVATNRAGRPGAGASAGQVPPYSVAVWSFTCRSPRRASAGWPRGHDHGHDHGHAHGQGHAVVRYGAITVTLTLRYIMTRQATDTGMNEGFFSVWSADADADAGVIMGWDGLFRAEGDGGNEGGGRWEKGGGRRG